MNRKYDSLSRALALLNGLGSLAVSMKQIDYAESSDALAYQRKLDEEERNWNKEMERNRIQAAMETAKIQLQEKSQLENTLVNKGIFEVFRGHLGSPHQDTVDQYGTVQRRDSTPDELGMLSAVDSNEHLQNISRKDTTSMKSVVMYNKLAKSAISNYNAGSNIAMRLDIDLNGIVTQPELDLYADGLPMKHNPYWMMGVNNYTGDPMVGLKVKEMLQGNAQALIDMEFKYGKDNVIRETKWDVHRNIQYDVINFKSHSEGFDPSITYDGIMATSANNMNQANKRYNMKLAEAQQLGADILTMARATSEKFIGLDDKYKMDTSSQVNSILGSLGDYEMTDINGITKQIMELYKVKDGLEKQRSALLMGGFEYGQRVESYMDRDGRVDIQSMLSAYEESNPEQWALTGGAGMNYAHSNPQGTKEARVQELMKKTEIKRIENQQRDEGVANEYLTQLATLVSQPEFDIGDYASSPMSEVQKGAFMTMASQPSARQWVNYMDDNEGVTEWLESGLKRNDPTVNKIQELTRQIRTNYLLADDNMVKLNQEEMGTIAESINAIIARTKDPVLAYQSAQPHINKGKKREDRQELQDNFFRSFEATHGYNPQEKIFESIKEAEKGTIADPSVVLNEFGTIPTTLNAEDMFNKMSKTGTSIGMTKNKVNSIKAFGGTSWIGEGTEIGDSFVNRWIQHPAMTLWDFPYNSFEIFKGKNPRQKKYYDMAERRVYGDSIYEKALAEFMWKQETDYETYTNASDKGLGRGLDLPNLFGKAGEAWEAYKHMSTTGNPDDGYLATALLGKWADERFKQEGTVKGVSWQKRSDDWLDNIFKLGDTHAKLAVQEAIAKAMNDPNDPYYAELLAWYNQNY